MHSWLRSDSSRFMLLRVVPHVLRDDFMTVGLLLVEATASLRMCGLPGTGSEWSALLRRLRRRFSKSWKRRLRGRLGIPAARGTGGDAGREIWAAV